MLAKIFSRAMLVRVQHLMCFFIVQNLRSAGTTISVKLSSKLPERGPLIIVSNHQSMFDIPLIIWSLRRFDPKFISKIELSRGLPSISFALRHTGCCLIDRADPRQAIPAISEFGKGIEEKKIAACIFPEGTRARDGKIKKFKSAGLRALIQNMPSAIIVPVAISNSWKIVRHKLFPVPFGTALEMQVLDPLEIKGKSIDDLTAQIEGVIAAHISPTNT